MLLFPPTRCQFSCDSCFPAGSSLPRSLTFYFFFLLTCDSSCWNHICSEMSLTAFEVRFCCDVCKRSNNKMKYKNGFVHDRMIRMAKYMDDDRDGKRTASKYQMTVVMEEISLFKKCHYFRAVLPFYRWNDIKAVWEDDATASMTTAVSFSLMMAWHRFPLPPHQRTLSPWTLVTGRAICYAVCVCVCVCCGVCVMAAGDKWKTFPYVRSCERVLMTPKSSSDWLSDLQQVMPDSWCVLGDGQSI